MSHVEQDVQSSSFVAVRLSQCILHMRCVKVVEN
jgi:hypothetical protein